MDTVTINNFYNYMSNKPANSYSTAYDVTVTGVTNANQELLQEAIADNQFVYINLTIQGTITYIEDYLFNYARNLKSIFLPNSITSIGEEALANSGVQYVNSSSYIHVTSIGEGAFAGCSKLESIYEAILQDITVIEPYTFSRSNKLTYLTFKGSLTSVDETAFTLSENLKKITTNSFSNIAKILPALDANTINSPYELIVSNVTNSNTIPDLLHLYESSAIGRLLYNNPTKYINLELNGTYTKIEFKANDDDNYVFNNLINLDISVSTCTVANVINPSATVEQFPNLKHIEVHRNIGYVNDTDSDILYTTDYSTAYFCPRGSERPVVIRAGTTTIGAKAFKNCKCVDYIKKIPASVTTVGSDAFLNNSVRNYYTSFEGTADQWASINFANENSNPLWGNHNNTSFIINNRSVIEGITFTNQLTEIKPYTFGCINGTVSSVTLPLSVTAIGHDAFANTSVKDLYYRGTVSQWCSINFGNALANPMCHGLDLTLYEFVNNLYQPVNNVDTGDTLTQIKTCVFYGYKRLSTLRIGTAVTIIGEAAFQSCTNLNSITIDSASITNLENSFHDLTGLRYVYGVPASVTDMSSCFKNCSNLLEIHGFKVDIENCDLDDAFSGCSSLRDIYIDYPQVVIENDTTWHVVSVDYSQIEEVTIKSYKTLLNSNNQLDLERTTTVQFSDPPELGIYNKVEEMAAATDLTDAEIKNLIKYKYPFGKTGEGLDPSQKSFVLWTANQDTVISNIISLKDTDYADIL